jgi:hypothetical protein
MYHVRWNGCDLLQFMHLTRVGHVINGLKSVHTSCLLSCSSFAQCHTTYIPAVAKSLRLHEPRFTYIYHENTLAYTPDTIWILSIMFCLQMNVNSLHSCSHMNTCMRDMWLHTSCLLSCSSSSLCFLSASCWAWLNVTPLASTLALVWFTCC